MDVIADTEDVARGAVRSVEEAGRKNRKTPVNRAIGEGEDKWILDGAVEISRRFEVSGARLPRRLSAGDVTTDAPDKGQAVQFDCKRL